MAGQAYRELHEARSDSIMANTSYKARGLKDIDKELFGQSYIDKEDHVIFKEISSNTSKSKSFIHFTKSVFIRALNDIKSVFI